MRRLLPYEQQLIEALGITQAEYLECLAIQPQYTDPKQGTIYDIRNDPGTQATVALVLTIVGTLAQVAAVLLTPRPEIPGLPSRTGQGGRQTRTAPRFGFNSAQELAKYGDIVPLIYTNISDNPEGAVRVATQLLWSAIQSLGTNQFVRLQLLIGAGKINQINADKCAFGQVPVRDLIGTNTWIYFNNQANKLKFIDSIKGTKSDDPTYTSDASNAYVVEKSISANSKDPIAGFSHAYTPSSANKFGIYAPVPINVFVYAAGGTKRAISKITLNLSAYTSGGLLNEIPKDATFVLTIAKTPSTGANAAIIEAQNARNGYAANFDEAGLFKLGSAIFRVTKVTGVSTYDSDISINFIRIGTDNAFSPATPYAAKTAAEVNASYKKSDVTIASATYIKNAALVEKLLEKDDRDVPYDDLPSNLKFSGYKQIDEAEDLLADGSIMEIIYGKIGKEEDFSNPIKWKTTKLSPGQKKALTSYIKDTKNVVLDGNDLFATKAIVRYEVASYSTLQACHAVDLNIKGIVYREISGKNQGMKHRSAMFILRYKKSNASTWSHVPGIFVVRRNNESENYLNIRFNSNQSSPNSWSFELEPIADPQAEAKTRNLRSGNKIQYFYIENATKPAQAQTVSLSDGSNVQFFGRTYASPTDYPQNTGSPIGTNEWDLFNVGGKSNYRLSLDTGPEFTLLSVTEHIFASNDITPPDKLYANMSLIGFNAYSSKGLQDLRSFTAYVEKGRPVKRLNAGYTGGNFYYEAGADSPSSYAPDIFLDTIIDKTDGIGKYAPEAAIDFNSLVIAKRFCKKNNLFFDGVIADAGSWREFWATVAPYSLLEFGRMNGRETLVPAVPVNGDGSIQTTPPISALFNQGNILEDSYKEEFLDFGSGVQDLIATVLYRSADADGIFARNKSVNIKLKDTFDEDAIRQTFDLSAYVSKKDQAVKYGQLLCNIRRHVRSAIEFSTFPTANPISPGAFIYVDVGQSGWNGVVSGVIGAGGVLNIPAQTTLTAGTKKFLLYKSGAGLLAAADYNVTESSGVFTASALSSKEGYSFVLGTDTAGANKRVFRVTEVEMSEEGAVTIRATSYPCKADGTSPIPNFNLADFTIIG